MWQHCSWVCTNHSTISTSDFVLSHLCKESILFMRPIFAFYQFYIPYDTTLITATRMVLIAYRPRLYGKEHSTMTSVLVGLWWHIFIRTIDPSWYKNILCVWIPCIYYFSDLLESIFVSWWFWFGVFDGIQNALKALLCNVLWYSWWSFRTIVIWLIKKNVM